jgi:hypothetical protein
MRFRKPPPVGTVIDWHPHFAWLPVDVGDCFVWLEWVERRRERKEVVIFIGMSGLPMPSDKWVDTYRLPGRSGAEGEG